jgi:nucleoside-diphosphate-sugar epimerase/carbamoylphosphate synthase large subunit
LKKFTIGISCIGSGVGQSVINSLKLSRLPLKTVGLGTNPFAYGAYDCDCYDYTKNIYAPDYIDDLLEKCQKHHIDLVIPGLDDEALIFAQNAERFNEVKVKAIAASENLISLCRDKERMFYELNPIANIFVRCYSKNTIKQDIAEGKAKFPLIAKPRGGFASRGVEILLNEDDLNKLTQEHIIQDLIVPYVGDPNREYFLEQISQNKKSQVSEISIQLVYSPTGDLMGRMASYNKLNNGVPIEILPFDDNTIWEIIDTLTPYLLKLGLVGPLNIQGRLTDNGLKIFEMNPRFTGISGLRALMGFNEVEACIKEWLGIDQGNNKLFFNYGLFGMRQTADKAIPIIRNYEIKKLSDKLNQSGYKRKERIFITGATGYLGQNLVNKLFEEQQYELWLYGRNKEKLENLFLNKAEKLFDYEDYKMGRIQFGNIDVLLHLGFARPKKSNLEIAESLKFTSDLFTRAGTHNVPTIINISSQSVYGIEHSPPWDESMNVAPNSVYGLAKYATEEYLLSVSKNIKSIKATSIRLGTLVGGIITSNNVDFISKMIANAKNGDKLTIYGGAQKMDRLDLRDAVDAISVLIRNREKINHSVYNLSSGVQYEVMEIAQQIINQVQKTKSNSNLSIDVVESQNNYPSYGLDVNRFNSTFDWKAKYDIKDSINSILKFIS